MSGVHKEVDNHLDVDLVVGRSVYGAVEAEPDHEYPSVHRKPTRSMSEVHGAFNPSTDTFRHFIHNSYLNLSVRVLEPTLVS